MKDNEAKIVRVAMEYSDGRVDELTGADAEKWLEAANGVAIMGAIHHCPFPKFEWKTTYRTDVRQ